MQINILANEVDLKYLHKSSQGFSLKDMHWLQKQKSIFQLYFYVYFEALYSR